MENKKNIFSRIITIILMVFIIFIIIGNFIISENPYIITKEIIICISLLVILCLSENFDNLSIPKLITLSKNIKEVQKENEKLKEYNQNLIGQVINMKNSNNQIMYNLPSSFNTIGSSNIEDLNTKKKDEEESVDEQINNNNNRKPTPEEMKLHNERFKYMRNLEVFLLKKIITNKDEDADIQYNVKVINNKPLDDKIMTTDARFDALKIYDNKNIFYEVKTYPQLLNFTYELYYKLKFVKLYGETNKCESKMVLILPKYNDELKKILNPSGAKSYHLYLKNKIVEKFESSIKSGLLEISEIEVSKKELDDYLNKK